MQWSPCFPLPRPRGALVAALHRVDQASDHTLASRCANAGAGNVTDVATAARGEQGKAHERRESRSAMRVREAGDLLGPTDPNGAAKDSLHIIGDILELG